jgi:hypothetical protein
MFVGLMHKGVESFQIANHKIGSDTYDSVYIKENNNVAVSHGFGSGLGHKSCINIILYVFYSLCSKVCLQM